MFEPAASREIGIHQSYQGQIDFEKIKQLIGKEQSRKLSRFFKSHRQRIYQLLLEHLREEPLSLYRTFLLNDPEGRRRVEVYLDSFEMALDGHLDTFLEDQKAIGYIRAMEGFHLNDVYGYTVAFKQTLWKAILEFNDRPEGKTAPLQNSDIFILHKLLDCSYYLLSLSFIQTRDEIIARHRGQLQALQRYAAEVVSIFEEEKIWAHATQGVYDIYGMFGTFLVLDDSDPTVDPWESSRLIGLQIPHDDLKNTIGALRRAPRLLAITGKNVQLSLSEVDDADLLRLICAPIQDRNSRLTGILFVHNQGSLFRFSRFDRNLLSQFAFYTGAVSANSRMVSEIAEKQFDLRILTGRLISVQEEERKRISADIHDVVTQALTGIGYKALFCMEIIDTDREKLKNELDQLTVNINEALHQSRQIISNLRPHILDDIGLVAAIRNLVNDFDQKFGMSINFSHPEQLEVNPDKGIALFRILQEALNNIRCHASATAVKIVLAIEESDQLSLIIRDNGCGFDSRRRRRFLRDSGLGLLTMRERAEDIGGTFRVFSRPGQGCKITVLVPMEGPYYGKSLSSHCRR